MTVVIKNAPSLPQRHVPKSKPSLCIALLKKAKEILILALKVILLGALALYQAELFLAGFIPAFLIKCIWRDKCTAAVRQVQEVVAKRPWFIAAICVATALIIPGSVLVIPPFLGGFYSGIKAANFCLRSCTKTSIG